MTSALTAEDIRCLRILSKENGHDTTENPIRQLNRLIALGLARVETHSYREWAGKTHRCREVTITPAGIAALAAYQTPPPRRSP